MGRALIIGCGGVASVAIQKCCQNSEVFEEIMIASRTKSKCDALKEKLAGSRTKIETAQVDADKVEEVIALIKSYKPDLVMNIALPYQDLLMIRSGGLSMTSAARRKVFPHILIIHGSGHIRRSLKMPA